jgi:hypothetical protein
VTEVPLEGDAKLPRVLLEAAERRPLAVWGAPK